MGPSGTSGGTDGVGRGGSGRGGTVGSPGTGTVGSADRVGRLVRERIGEQQMEGFRKAVTGAGELAEYWSESLEVSHRVCLSRRDDPGPHRAQVAQRRQHRGQLLSLVSQHFQALGQCLQGSGEVALACCDLGR